MLEWATVFGHSYGTPRAPVEQALLAGRDVVFDIDWQGHRQLRTALPGDVVGVFILPPSLAALEARLRGRAGDGAAEVARRMQAARDEMRTGTSSTTSSSMPTSTPPWRRSVPSCTPPAAPPPACLGSAAFVEGLSRRD